MALTQGRKVQERGGKQHGHPVAANAVIHAGALVVLAAGWAAPGRTGAGADNAAKAADAATLQVVGVAEEAATGGPANGDVRVRTRAGCFLFDNLSTDAVTRADIGKACFLVDDETVAKTSPNNTRARAGIVDDLEDTGVWVRVGAGR
ncbi:hypothetical protein [Brevundimonas sp. SPF441]|uniref:hypothetical protein n=1 Tax=Brevundimonas sp. SPF441 TaxID=2663795 RepID=UPI00129D37E0|nr:hypothetical protein [Brevundimonas sp. SPF441]MRL67871.1 hypothetical protein [Brevundimonas sp. SPF441]